MWRVSIVHAVRGTFSKDLLFVSRSCYKMDKDDSIDVPLVSRCLQHISEDVEAC